MAANGPEHAASTDLGCGHPTINRFLDPDGHGHGPDMGTLADQVDNGPCLICMSFTSRADSSARRKPQPSYHGNVTETAKIMPIGVLQKQFGLIAG